PWVRSERGRMRTLREERRPFGSEMTTDARGVPRGGTGAVSGFLALPPCIGERQLKNAAHEERSRRTRPPPRRECAATGKSAGAPQEVRAAGRISRRFPAGKGGCAF